MLNLFVFFIKLFGILLDCCYSEMVLLQIAITFHVVRYMRATCIRKIYFAPFYMCLMSKTFHDLFRETHSRIHDANMKMHILSKYRFHLISLCKFPIKKRFQRIIVISCFTYRNKKIKRSLYKSGLNIKRKLNYKCNHSNLSNYFDDPLSNL